MASKQTIKRIQAIQRRLNLSPDGIIGPATLTALEHVINQVLGPPSAPVIHQMRISKKSLDLIIDFEIFSKAFYRRKLTHPIWPGHASGVTIGIGYDLGYHSKTQIEKDWKGKIDDTDLADLLLVSGLKRQAAKDKISSLRHITIDLEVAEEVFHESVVVNWAKKTAKAFPGVEKLPADAQGALLSLCFNRGTSIRGERRREMRVIKGLIPLGDLKGIANQIRSMKRIWEGKNLRGLLVRRDKEADLVENARPDNTLTKDDIILV